MLVRRSLSILESNAGPNARLLLAWPLMLILAACTHLEPGVDAKLRKSVIGKEVDAVVLAALEKGAYPGIAVSISQHGDTVYAQGYGVESMENGDAVSPKTIFPMGSVTKSFTALAVAQLAVIDQLDLDDSIATYIDDLPKDWDEIKVRNLLNHTSGVFDYTNSQVIQGDPGKDYTFTEIRKVWEDVPLAFPPNTQWQYNNSGYYLLGKIIEKVTGLSYAEYLDENIFQPFGMKDTEYPSTREGKPGATGYYVTGKGLTPSEIWSPTIPYAAGALLTTVDDLAVYAHAVHASEKVSDRVRRVLYTKDTVSGETIQYALGGLNIQALEGRERYAHPGSIWGYTSYFAYYPQSSVAISILTNGDESPVHPSNIERKLARIVFGENQPVYTDKELTEKVVAAVEGDYSTKPMDFISSTVGFEARNGMLFMVFGGVESEIFAFPLRYVGGDMFVAHHDDEITVRFDDIAQKATQAEFVFYGGLLTARR